MVKTKAAAHGCYVPDRGDLVWLVFDPQAGHEQAGRRPALVLSPKNYNAKTGLALLCPITSKVKGYPFEVTIVEQKINGVILSDQIKSLDWRARQATLAGKAHAGTVIEVLSKLQSLLT